VIHPTAIIDSSARIHPSVQVGPYAVIDGHVTLGEGCVVGPHVYITGHTTIGARNRFFAGCVIGEAPQDLKYKGEPTEVRIGDHNVFRESTTVHRSAATGKATILGSHNYLMACSHVGHNCQLGDHNILANGVLLGGYAILADRIFLSGNALVHQFARIGTLAMMQGMAAISKDLPPFTVARGINAVCGLNTVGLRRAGINPAQRLELRQVYHAVFRSGAGLRKSVQAARESFSGEHTLMFLDFIDASTRGVCSDPGRRRDSAVEAEE
jgi:UDP-N-acetylglucosamine acyltransferase